MNTAFILAEFIGVDPSSGYSRGKVYPLIVSKLGRFASAIRGVRLEIIGVDGKGYLSYKNEENFHRNWLVIPEGKYIVKIEELKKGVKKNG